MSARRTVLFFESHSQRFDGAQQSLFLLLTNLDSTRFRPVFLGPAEGELPSRLRNAGIKTIVLPPPTTLNRYGGALLRARRWSKAQLIIPYLHYTHSISRILKDEHVDVVHANSIRSLLTMAAAARIRRLPLLWHLRLNLELGHWNRLGCRLADRIIVVSDSLRREFPGGPPDDAKFVTVFNGIDAGLYGAGDRAAVRAELGLEGSYSVIGMIGSITERKGQHILLQSAAQIARQLPQARFVIVGRPNDERDQEYEEQLRADLEPLGLKGKVTFAGWRADVPRVLSAMDLFVLPSFNEGLPRVVLEAMASAVPVVATTVGGNAELVVDGQTGLLTPASNADAMAEAVCRILADPQVVQRMGAAGRARVIERFSLRAAASGVETVIDELLQRDAGHYGASRTKAA